LQIRCCPGPSCFCRRGKVRPARCLFPRDITCSCGSRTGTRGQGSKCCQERNGHSSHPHYLRGKPRAGPQHGMVGAGQQEGPPEHSLALWRAWHSALCCCGSAAARTHASWFNASLGIMYWCFGYSTNNQAEPAKVKQLLVAAKNNSLQEGLHERVRLSFTSAGRLEAENSVFRCWYREQQRDTRRRTPKPPPASLCLP